MRPITVLGEVTPFVVSGVIDGLVLVSICKNTLSASFAAISVADLCSTISRVVKNCSGYSSIGGGFSESAIRV